MRDTSAPAKWTTVDMGRFTANWLLDAKPGARAFVRSAVIVVALLTSCIAAADAKSSKGKVKLSLPPGNFSAHQNISVTVINSGSAPITYCVAIGRDPQGVLSASDKWPEPFYIQINTYDRWRTPVGCGTGVYHAPVTLKSGESQEYPLNFAATGRMRLVLEYWQAADADTGCRETPKHTKVARSREFTVE
jgi:hypothetical protein